MDSTAASDATTTWADYRRLSRLFWALLVLGLVATLTIAGMFLVERHGIHGLLWPLLAWASAVVYAGLRMQEFRCPRCHRRFFRRSPPLLALRGRQCINCSLPKE